MTQRYDLIVGREYGTEGKTAWTRIGSAWPAKNGGGFSLTFDALPLPGKDGACRVLMREPQARNDVSSRASRPGHAPLTSADIGGDDIPF